MDGDHSGGGLTLGERIRSIEDLAQRTYDHVTELNARDRADHVRLSALNERVASIEASVTWLWRTVLGAVIVAGFGVLLAKP